MTSATNLGKLGEQDAARYLQEKSFLLLENNFRSNIGELDIIAKKDNTYIFVEVKSRIGDTKGKPYEAVTPRKISHIKRAAYAYLLQNDINNAPLRIDVVSIEYNQDLSVKELVHFENITG